MQAMKGGSTTREYPPRQLWRIAAKTFSFELDFYDLKSLRKFLEYSPIHLAAVPDFFFWNMNLFFGQNRLVMALIWCLSMEFSDRQQLRWGLWSRHVVRLTVFFGHARIHLMQCLALQAFIQRCLKLQLGKTYICIQTSYVLWVYGHHFQWYRSCCSSYDIVQLHFSKTDFNKDRCSVCPEICLAVES